MALLIDAAFPKELIAYFNEYGAAALTDHLARLVANCDTSEALAYYTSVQARWTAYLALTDTLPPITPLAPSTVEDEHL